MQNIELRFLILRSHAEKYDDHEERWFQIPIDSKPVLQYREPNQEWKDVPIVIQKDY